MGTRGRQQLGAPGGITRAGGCQPCCLHRPLARASRLHRQVTPRQLAPPLGALAHRGATHPAHAAGGRPAPAPRPSTPACGWPRGPCGPCQSRCLGTCLDATGSGARSRRPAGVWSQPTATSAWCHAVGVCSACGTKHHTKPRQAACRAGQRPQGGPGLRPPLLLIGLHSPPSPTSSWPPLTQPGPWAVPAPTHPHHI